MKYFIIHDGKTIKHIEPIGHNFTASDVLVVDSIPQPEQQEGKYPVLVWSLAEGLHYEYHDIPEPEATEEDYKTSLNTLGVDTNEEINT